ncbi:ricin-type beta-trefoil lectin domain protein [Streptomyces sp. S.PNR 29]|uniref:ricin-type beta-trefoil lectin domain protein n=1 Tax=Streptomyces sp. S.PNR 29 TaxID=2973805 RepID=UPI0025AF6502|nr:ricin-type beta-trefoil lectin domain protein [Streptomyces sp. S.PNR 29]MDN0193765.1 ricin-type beta-trefoil lectin domain protein [Streptomyces sp. S.PNR 29]
MADVLRLGGAYMAATAQDGLNQPPDKLHTLADREHWEQTPLAGAYQKDRDAAARELDAVHALRNEWAKPLDGLETPGGFTVTEFHWPPGGPGDTEEDFHSQTGLTNWIADRFWKSESDFYEDPTPKADDKTFKAITDLGTPLYGEKPYDPSLPSDERARQYNERQAFEYLTDGFPRASADDARLFLAFGGFPRSAPQPGTAEYRIAVEELKTRYASCAWRDPIDPNKVLGGIADTAASEWQQEIAAQATQRNQILNASKDASNALAAGAKALGNMLGDSWVADHLARWQDYWAPGGLGWIGDSPAVIQVEAAKGKCLDVQGGKETDGTSVQIYTCNDSAAQEWQVQGYGDAYVLLNVKAQKCLDVQSSNPANGTKIQLWSCNNSKAQQWTFDVRAAGELRNVATDKCLDLNKFDNGQDSWLWACNGTNPQKFRVVPKGHKGTDSLSYPDKAQFDKAKKGLAAAQARAKKQLDALKAQLAVAQKAATASDTAEQAAYAVADAGGAPRGRGLLASQQKAQVTKGAVAALEALVKAGETAEAATRASAGDSETITQRALAQAAQSKAEFRKAAAAAAEAQAKAAADAAKVHRDNAKKDKETAEAKLAEALKAEGDAKAAAAEAHAERLAAEAEEKTAKAEKETAAAKQAEAAQHRKNAEAEADKAKDARDKAEAAEGTAVEKKNAAVAARDNAKAKRDDAWEAEQKADAARAKADAKEAYAESLEAGEAADAARVAATEADKHADDAEAAVGRARSEADAATKAAADADAAATRAEAAAKRARAHADDAQAAKLKADAAVKTATSAAADAIKASEHAAAEAKTAVELADEAEKHAKTAKSHADEANKEAAKALAASAKAAGFAHVTAQAAVDAGNAAAQVAKPANDAVQLGSPYVTTDSAAGLVVLTGQASKSIAEQQKAVAEAHAKNAQAEAAAAKNLADQAKGDAKAAYQHAANAAGHASDARTYAKEALGYAADAAKAASQAQASLARTIEYDRQAAVDAEAADKAAGRAEGYAKDARDSADQAALDAEAARTAASQAEQAAKDARAAANRADAAATEAEEAAKDAQKYADEAQAAADSAERKEANKQVSSGAGTGIGGTFYVVDEDSVEVTDATPKEKCQIESGFEGCTVTFAVTFDATVDFFLCTNPDVPATASGCPADDTLLIKTERLKGLKKDVTQYFSKLDLIQQTVVYRILKAVLVQDFLDCWHGSVNGCAWAASNFVPGKVFVKVADALNALDAALKTGIGVADAYKALKNLDIDPSTLAAIERQVNIVEDALTSCRVNSFPADTPVLMADGTRRPIGSVHEGDLVLATDPETGAHAAQPVTDTFRHATRRLVDVSFADGSRLTSTAGHRVYVDGRGWTFVADLRTGDRLRGPDGTPRAVRTLRDRPGLAPRTVYDLTVDGLHTFYVATQGTTGAPARDVLVHNCLNLTLHEGDRGAHTIKDHVKPTPAEARAKAQRDWEKNPDTHPGVTGVWENLDTAQAAVDDAMEKWLTGMSPTQNKKNRKRLDKWMLETPKDSESPTDLLSFDVRLDDTKSLGTVYHRDGSSWPAENIVSITLKRSKHSPGYMVYTAYPKGKRP